MSDSNSERVEMYLKTVAELGGEFEPVSIGRVAERLSITPASANEMMKRLGEADYIDHLPYRGVTLTESGRRLANSVIRRQRLWECFLVQRLNLDWAKAYDMACDLEHATAPDVTEALAAFLDYPATCPHGNPIPDPAAPLTRAALTPLSELTAGEKARIRSISPESSDILPYLADRNLLPGKVVEVIEVAPMEGPLTLKVTHDEDDPAGGQEVVLGKALAGLLIVETDDAPAPPLNRQIPLSQLGPGQQAKIVRVGGNGQARRRYLEMGFVRGEIVHVQRVAPLGDPVEYRVKGYHISLRRADAQNILVEITGQEQHG